MHNEKKTLSAENGFEILIVPVDIIHSIDDDYVWLYIDNKQVHLSHSIDVDKFFKIFNEYIESLNDKTLVVPEFSKYYLQRKTYDITKYDDFRDIPKSMIDY